MGCKGNKGQGDGNGKGAIALRGRSPDRSEPNGSILYFTQIQSLPKKQFDCVSHQFYPNRARSRKTKIIDSGRQYLDLYLA